MLWAKGHRSPNPYNHIIIITSSASINTSTSSTDISTRTRDYIIIITSSTSTSTSSTSITSTSPSFTKMGIPNSNSQLILRESKVPLQQICCRPIFKHSIRTRNHQNRCIAPSLPIRTNATEGHQLLASARPTFLQVHHLHLVHGRHAPLKAKSNLPTKTNPGASPLRFRPNVESGSSVTWRLSKMCEIAGTVTGAPPIVLQFLARFVKIPRGSA